VGSSCEVIMAVLTPLDDIGEVGMRGSELLYTDARGWLRRGEGEVEVAEGPNDR
jgi:hypothetical protein